MNQNFPNPKSKISFLIRALANVALTPFLFLHSAVMISGDEIKSGSGGFNGVGAPASAFLVETGISTRYKVEGSGSVQMKFKRTEKNGAGDMVRLEVQIPRGTLNLSNGSAHLHLMSLGLPETANAFLLMESPGANAVMALPAIQQIEGAFKAVELSAERVLQLPGTKQKINPAMITRIFLGIGNPVENTEISVFMDALSSEALAPIYSLTPVAHTGGLPLKLIKASPHVHDLNYSHLEDSASPEVRAYPAPVGAPIFVGRKTALKIGGNRYEVPLYETPVWNGKAYHGSIDCNRPAEMEIAVTDLELKTAVIRPLSKNIEAKISGNLIRFKIDGPGKYIVEINGNLDDAVLLFVNPVEKNVPVKSGPGLVYFGPGFYSNVGILKPKSNETWYIAGGAYLHHGRFDVENASGVVIRGRGIIDSDGRFNGYKRDPVTEHSLRAFEAGNLTVEGLTFLDANNFCTVYRRCHDVRIRNIKVIAQDGNTDQNDLVGCQRVHLSDLFLRGRDDGIVVKVAHEAQDLTSCDILAERSVIWTDQAHPLTIGVEVMNNVHHVTFTNIDILHVREPAHNSRVLAIHAGDDGTIHDITFADIRIESLSPPFANGDIDLIQLEIGYNTWSKRKQPGYIRNVLFKDITLMQAPFTPRIVIEGFDAGHTIENVRFENVTVKGKKILSFQDGNIHTNQFVKNLVFSP